MKKILIITIILLNINVTNAQWYMTNFGGGHFSQISFTNNNIGYILDDDLWNSNIYKTIDAGNSWSIINTTVLQSYPNVFFFVNDTMGFIGGSTYIGKTTDGGITWSNTTGYSNNIISIFFSSVDIGYYCNSDVIFKTTDNSTTWNNLNVPANMKPVKLYFNNDSVGFALSDTAKGIYRTINGGTGWSFIPIGTLERFNFIDFLNDSVGYVNGNDEIWKTTNGGISWFQITNGVFNTTLNKAIFLNENLAYAINCCDTNVYYTIDGGANWLLQPYNANSVWLTDITFTSDSMGYCVGGLKYTGAEYGIVIRTLNGGLITREKESSINNPDGLICFPNPTKEKLNIETQQFSKINLLTIYNINGQIELEQQLQDNKTEIDISNLTNGMYFLKLTNNQTVFIRKIIKE